MSIHKLTAWKYRLEATVANFDQNADFLVSFSIAWRQGMRYDFRDLRYMTAGGTVILPHYETYTNFTSAKVWLKLPKGTSFFWVFYGNGGAPSKTTTSMFTFFEGFTGTSINTSVWNTAGTGITVSGGILQLLNTSTSCYIETKNTFPVNSLLEMRCAHQAGQRGPFGFRSQATAKAAGWQGAASGNNNDIRYTNSGSAGDWDDDGVSRAGHYHVYGVAHINAAPRFYVDYSYRGNNTTTYPGSGELPIHFYAYSNEGYVQVDWIRVRPYVATEPVVTFGRRFLNKITEKAYPWDNSITGVSTTLGLSCHVTLKTFLSNIRTNLGLRAAVMFRHPQYYMPAIRGPFTNWKFEGSIDLGDQGSPARLQMPVYPGMRINGRDLRFVDQEANEIGYNIFDTTADGKLDIWVDNAGKQRIKFYYGNGVATEKSNPAIVGTPTTETIYTTVVNFAGGTTQRIFPKWKYEGVLNLSAMTSAAGGEQTYIFLNKLPGMTTDGRDLRFTDRNGRKIGYWIESSSDTQFIVWLKLPALHDKIRFFYGNGAAVSESSADSVFLLYDEFSTFDTANKWTLEQGTASVSGGTLVAGSASVNTLVRSKQSFPPGTVMEMRCHHPQNNQMINGFYASNNNRAAWLGASGANNNDYVHTYNGTSSTTTSDGVDRSGTTYYNYMVKYKTGSVEFIVNWESRQTITTTTPTGDLPITIYSEVNSGNVVVDWVRVWTDIAITPSLGRHWARAGITYYETTTSEEVTIIPTTKIKHWPHVPAVQIYYDYIKTPNTILGLQMGEPTLIERRELKDYNTGSISVDMSINDAYSQLSTEFYDSSVPPEDSNIKHNAYDSAGDPHLLFIGKILPSVSSMGRDQQRTRITAVDNCVNLVTQLVPWNYQVIDTSLESIPTWIERLISYEDTGVYLNTVIDTLKDPYQFVFDAKTKRLDAIKKIAEYAGCIYTSKIKSRTIDGLTYIRPEFYFVPPERIDETVNGFDLPDPITLITPANSVLTGSTLLDEPQIEKESEEKYNKVTVYGVLSDTKETVVASAMSYEVYTGAKKAREYPLQDNSLVEKGSTAEREAVKWLLYFLAPRARVKMKFANRFDLELYQRIKFGSGFPNKFTELTSSYQVPQVAVCDPRDYANSVRLIDVSQVPRPAWLRISDLKYTSDNPLETVEVEAITDTIYSVVDPIVQAPYNDYISPGYYKPIINDSFSNTQSIVDDNMEKQFKSESGTVLSVNTENQTAVIQTKSGKLITVML